MRVEQEDKQISRAIYANIGDRMATYKRVSTLKKYFSLQNKPK